MTKAEIVSEVRDCVGSTRVSSVVVKDVLEQFIALIRELVIEGEKVAVAGLGTFNHTVSAERQGINPKTKEKMTINPKVRLKFKPSKDWSDEAQVLLPKKSKSKKK